MQITGQVFTGKMDQDSDPRVVSSEDFLSASDILNGFGEQPGVAVSPKGNLLYDLGLPSGTNICIGAPEDKQSSALIIFIWNSNGDHRIFKWLPADGTHYTLAKGEFLNFSGDWRINHAKIVDGKLLYWTDAISTNDIVVEGNPQRKLNIEKATLDKPLFNYEVYAGRPGEGQFANGNEYRFAITDLDGLNETEVNVYTADGTYLDDPAGGLEWLRANLEVDYTYPTSEFDSCDGCKIKFSLPQLSTPKRITLVASADDVLLVGIDIYPVDMEEHHIDLLKQPPHCAPTATYYHDTSVSANNVDRLCAQFRVRYIYDDRERSAWSPVSNVALGTGIDGEPVSLFNAILIDFTDERLSNPSWLTMIREVEVAFRDGNSNDWKQIRRVPVCEIGVFTQAISFYNDKQYSTLPSDDTSTDSTLQVLKPFDFLPVRSLCLETTADAEGNSLLFLGANEEGYDNPDCIEMTVEAVEYEDDCLIDIIGTVEIVNDSNFPDANPSFSNYALDGIVVYLAGTSYYGISNNPADGSGDGYFIIKGVPKGRYIMRAASYKCSFTNDLGPRYNMANGFEWQRTSAPVIDMAGAVSNSDTQYERAVDLGAFTDPVFDLDTEVGFGAVQIQNGHWENRLIWDPDEPSPQNNHSPAYVFNEVYLLDNSAEYDTVDLRKSAISVERQTIILNDGVSGLSQPVLKTDHNGYVFYGEFSDTDDTNYYLVSLSVNGNDVFTGPTQGAFPGDFAQMYDETMNNNWSGASGHASNMLYSPSFPSDPHDPPLFYTQTLTVFNDDTLDILPPIVIKVRAVIDDGVTGLDNVIFTYTRTGRFAVTGPDGYGLITVYIPDLEVPFIVRTRDNDYITALYPPDFCHDGYPDPDNELVAVDENTVGPYDGPTFQFLLADMDLKYGRFLKGGGEYTFGVVYEDRGNRTPGVAIGPKLSVPAHIDGLTKWQMRWTINSNPPAWATHYRIVRLLNAVQSVYVQWTIKTAKYVKIPSQLEDPIETSFASGDYTHLLFQLYTPITTDPDADPAVTLFFQQDGQQGYVPQNGDKVRLLLDSAGNPVNTAEFTYESEIVGTYVSGSDVYAIVPAVFGNLEVTSGFLAEYYTPVTGSPEIYYEGGEDCYEIGDPGSLDAYHKGPIADQSLIGDTPAEGMYTGGDTYWRRQKFTETGIYETEHQTPHRYITGRCEDIGRAFTLADDNENKFHNNRIRISGVYIPDSTINGMSSYASLDYKTINRQWGTIKWLGFAHNVLLAICKFKVQPLYVSKGQLLYLSGLSSVGRSDQILDVANESVTDYGTHNPESVVVEGNNVYFWDKFQGTVCRYAQNGVVPITTGMIKYFKARGRERLVFDNDLVVGGYDRRHEMYLLSFSGQGEFALSTIGYDEVKGGWPCFHSFVPEYYGRVGQHLLSFKNGAMWRHFEGASYANYYGVQYKPQFKLAVNQYPSLVKKFMSLRINSNRQWEAPTITIPFNYDYSSGMSSKLVAGNFKSYEGQWMADFLRDQNDTDVKFAALTPLATKQLNALLRGRPLRGEYMELTIRMVDGSTSMVISRLDVSFLAENVSKP